MTSATPQRVIGAPPTEVTSITTKHSVRIALGDTPEVLPIGRSHVFRPEAVYLSFLRHEGTRGGWVVQKAEVCGTKLKQDGSLGRTPARVDYAADLSKAPFWVNALVEQHMPSELGPAVAA